MRPHQIYTNGIITNHKPFHMEPEPNPYPVATAIIGVAVAVALYALLIIQYLYQ